MKPAQTRGSSQNAPDYNARIRRAQKLASVHPFAAEVLGFYQKIAEFQKDLYAHIARSSPPAHVAGQAGQLRGAWNAAPLLSKFPEMLAVLERHGPEPVRQAARHLASRGQTEWTELLTNFWNFAARSNQSRREDREAASDPLAEFTLRAFLQPYAEFVNAPIADPPLATSYRQCPRCGHAPLLGVLRPEGDGGKRRLMCSFCLQEWDFRRIFCAACGEAAEQKLPVYVAESFPHVRVESCETCKFYLRTIDLTKDGNAIPVVDDLAAIPLSLWAEERGYQRIHPNLLGS